MASVIQNSFLEDLARGNVDLDTDTFRGMLLNPTGMAVADNTKKDSWLKRSDVTGYEVTGTGYTAGGAVVTLTVTKDTANDRLDVTFSSPSWSSSTISANGIQIYKARGGAATADELVCTGDFGGAVSSTSATFTVTFSSPLRFQN